jgi:hypothetical protein
VVGGNVAPGLQFLEVVELRRVPVVPVGDKDIFASQGISVRGDGLAVLDGPDLVGNAVAQVRGHVRRARRAHLREDLGGPPRIIGVQPEDGAELGFGRVHQRTAVLLGPGECLLVRQDAAALARSEVDVVKVHAMPVRS